jgi:hypothetical protein
MKILIDNSDYTSGLDAVRPLEIVRKLNEPSTCRLWLSLLPGGALGVPIRNQALVVTGDDGTVYFTGYLANLTSLTVTAISTAAVSVSTGVAAPAGGGFEVRLRDFAFQPGNDPDLVIRSVVENVDIPRATAADRFYVRMYDGTAVEDGGPNYSEYSVGLFVNLPLSV